MSALAVMRDRCCLSRARSALVCRVDSLDLEGEVAESLEDREQVRLIDHSITIAVVPFPGSTQAGPTVDSRLSLRNVEAKRSLSSPRTTISYVTPLDVLGRVPFGVIDT
jgi:hypothetical protein